MNVGLQSYMDTRLAANIFKVLPATEKQTVGVKLLTHALQTNRFNPDVWYRLAKQTPGALQGLRLAQAAMSQDPGGLVDEPLSISLEDFLEGKYPRPVAEAMTGYWRTLAEFVTRYSILAHPVPLGEADMHRVYTFLQSVPGIKTDDLVTYVDKFVARGAHEPQANAVIYDQNLAYEADVYGQLRMGERYEDGDGVPKDETKAEAFFAESAAQGDKVASLALERLNPSIPSNVITVIASSVYSPDQVPRHLVDGSGLLGGVHDNNGAAQTMWQSSPKPAPTSPDRGLAPSPAWVRFDFAQPQKFDAIQIWNHNQAKLTDRGFRKTRIYGSSEGVTWFPLTSPEMIELPRASGSPFAEAVTIPNAAPGRPITSVIIAAETVDGNYGSECYGLSAVRFIVHH